MAHAYATIVDLQRRWPGLPAASHERAQALLEDAAVQIDAEKAPIPDPVTGLLPDAAARRMISCAMVERAMMSDGQSAPVVQQSETMGPFSRSATFANPTGDLYLTKAERKLLGVGKQEAFTVSMAPDVPTDPLWWLP
jgi:hypothetical protein